MHASTKWGTFRSCLKKVTGTFKFMPQKSGGISKFFPENRGGSFRCPRWDQTAVLRQRIRESGGDAADPGLQCISDSTSTRTIEHQSHCANDATGNDNVLERHHAVLVRAQTLQGFAG